ncbi:hypothetical protein Bca52824_011183 [Brassica carinata]|uniref:Uncharacterized protein n=1 Tax=Brassica carinata TaxID=52824 RepID=A0A8X7WGP2_BRACI|nr:hypothetical protein Bca52824_011183 [Brassica carinata]
MSSSKGSSKRHSSSHSSSDDSSANELPPLQDIPVPKRLVRSPNAPLTPSIVSPGYLATHRNFYQVPSGVVFGSSGSGAREPSGRFLHFSEAFLSYCRMWFPIPTIVRSFTLWASIQPAKRLALQQLGVLISSSKL